MIGAMKKFYLVLANLVLCFSLSAQDVLITTRGDTLKGKLTIYTNRQGNQLINMKVDRKKQQYRLIDIQRFYKKGEGFKTLFVSGRYRVVKIVNEGEFLGEYLYTPTSHSPVPEFSQGLLYKSDGDQIDIPKALLFRKTVAGFLTECPEVYEKVLNKTYGKSQMESIIRDYNACMASEAEAIEKQKSVESLLTELRDALQKSSKVSGKAEIREMLDDLKSKVDAKEAIPGYLRTALTNALKEDIELSSLLEEILNYK